MQCFLEVSWGWLPLYITKRPSKASYIQPSPLSPLFNEKRGERLPSLEKIALLGRKEFVIL